MSTIGEIQTPLPTTQAVLIGVLAAILVTGSAVWNNMQHAETVVHEGAHVVVGISTGYSVPDCRPVSCDSS